MGKYWNLLLPAAVAMVLVSCAQQQSELREKISNAEKSLFTDSVTMIPDHAKADSIVALYEDYALKFQDDTLSPEYLYRAGDVCNGVGRYKEAVGYFGRVQRYPNYAKLPAALFLQGFISENNLQDTAAARRFYEKFLSRFPEHKLAPDVKLSLENMGKTPEELIREFEQRNTDTLTQK